MTALNEPVVESNQDTKENLAADMENLKKSFGQLRTDLTSLINSAMGIGKSGAGVVREQAASAVDGVKHRITDLADKGSDGVEAVGQKIQENPLTGVLIAFGAGFILARLLTRK